MGYVDDLKRNILGIIPEHTVLPSYKDRLRPAQFVDPDGEVYDFNVNTLERSFGKKGSTQEILDSDESMFQDQGNKVWTFPIDAYFTGLNYDIPTDNFVLALSKKYSQENPGILKHPRWGDINVAPNGISQKEELINGAMVGRVTVVFVKVYPRKYPDTEGKSLDDAIRQIEIMTNISEDLSSNFLLDGYNALANAGSKILGAVGIVSNSIGAVSDGIDSVQDTFDSIQSAVNNSVDDLAGNIINTIAGTQRLIRTPARIKNQLMSSLKVYSEMITTLCTSFYDANEVDKSNQKNNAMMIELIGGFGVVVTGEIATKINLTTRDEAINIIETLTSTLETFNTFFESSRVDGSAIQEYSGDHNFYSLLLDTISRINEIILNKAFDLKAEKRYILKVNSDPITECYKVYGNVDTETMEFYILSNNLINDEFIDIPAGRELVYYE